MKNSLAFYGLALLLLLLSCNNRSSDSKSKAKEANKEKIDSMRKLAADSAKVIPSKEDADFLVDAASGGMMEVAFGQLAVSNSRNQQVKDFGTLMKNDHGACNEKLKKLAISKKITLPETLSTDQKKEKDMLQKMKGSDFDKAYINMMVNDHKKDIKKFEKAAKNAADSDIKAFAAENLPMLYKHLDAIENLQKKMKTNEKPVLTPPYE